MIRCNENGVVECPFVERALMYAQIANKKENEKLKILLEDRTAQGSVHFAHFSIYFAHSLSRIIMGLAHSLIYVNFN